MEKFLVCVGVSLLLLISAAFSALLARREARELHLRPMSIGFANFFTQNYDKLSTDDQQRWTRDEWNKNKTSWTQVGISN